MGLAFASLKNLATVDDGRGIGFMRVYRDWATRDIEGVANIAVEVPRHLLAGCEDQMTDLDLIGREDPF